MQLHSVDSLSTRIWHDKNTHIPIHFLRTWLICFWDSLFKSVFCFYPLHVIVNRCEEDIL